MLVITFVERLPVGSFVAGGFPAGAHYWSLGISDAAGLPHMNSRGLWGHVSLCSGVPKHLEFSLGYLSNE